nr:unnamed protein product [Callosobruchus analis]
MVLHAVQMWAVRWCATMFYMEWHLIREYAQKAYRASTLE